MKRLFFYFSGVLLAAGLLTAPPAHANTCPKIDTVIIPGWSENLYMVTTFAARAYGLDREHCVDFQFEPMTSFEQMLNLMQRGVPGATVLSTDLGAYAANQRQKYNGSTNVDMKIVGFLANTAYGLYVRPGTELADGLLIATTRCGWKDQDLTTPLPASALTEGHSTPTLVMLPWLRERLVPQGLGIWCGVTPPDNFRGVQLVPVGTGGKRQAAFDAPVNGIDGVIHTIERSVVDVQSGALTMIAAPSDMQLIPEAIFSASADCLANAECFDIIKRALAAYDATRQRLLVSGVDEIGAQMRAIADAAGPRGSFRGLDNPEVLSELAQYLYEHQLPQTTVTRESLLDLVTLNEWPIEPEEVELLVDGRLLTLE